VKYELAENWKWDNLFEMLTSVCLTRKVSEITGDYKLRISDFWTRALKYGTQNSAAACQSSEPNREDHKGENS